MKVLVMGITRNSELSHHLTPRYTWIWDACAKTMLVSTDELIPSAKNCTPWCACRLCEFGAAACAAAPW